MKENKIQIVARKIDGSWEGALVSQGKFTRALVGKDLFKMVTSQLVAYLVSNRPDETEIIIEIVTAEPEDNLKESDADNK